LSRPGISAVLTGASSPGQIEANARAADFELSQDLLEEIELALCGAHDEDAAYAHSGDIVTKETVGVDFHATR
jgi:hypothetical protein